VEENWDNEEEAEEAEMGDGEEQTGRSKRSSDQRAPGIGFRSSFLLSFLSVVCAQFSLVRDLSMDLS